ncbi:golgin subfamily A member 6-like protein 22 [Dysidea avara]|uniref:golgin subfamily A member 6-like protein 22 n=1 Tax=Dysidea avara TaxID=196820 RepID=UPI00331AEFFF
MSGAKSERYEKLQQRFETLTSRAKTGQSLIPDDAKKETKVRPRSSDPQSIRERAQQSLQDTAKRLKVIEEHMWQHRQQERELKRAEMDLVKQQKQVRQAMRQAETDLARKEGDQLQWLQEQERKFESFQDSERHKKEEMSLTKKQQLKEQLQRTNEQVKRCIRNETETSWRYCQLMKQLELRRHEVEQLSKDFENKIKAKEDEQHHLKQQLAELAIQINMDTHKVHQTEVEDRRLKQFAQNREIEVTKQREESLQAEEATKNQAGARYERNITMIAQGVANTKGSLQRKSRKDGHLLAGVQNKLKQNLTVQKMGQRAAEDVELRALGKHSHYRVEIATNKRQSLMEDYEESVRQRNAVELHKWEERVSRQQSELKKKQHVDRLRQLQKTVSRFDENEHATYAQVKTAEASRKKQDQVVTRLQSELETMKRDNARRLKDAAMKAKKAEVELEQKLLRETAELTKALNLREEGIKMLAYQRNLAREERWMLQEERKEHQRQHRIIQQTDVLS